MMTLGSIWAMLHDVAGGSFAAPAVTIVAFVGARRLQTRWPNNPLLNPTLVAVVLMIGFIETFDISYTNYLASTQIISFMLGPAIVLLAVPLYRRLALIRESWALILAAILVGLPVGIASSVAIGLLCGAEADTIYALAPKSVTAGISMGIEQLIGGIPALTAVFAICTGIMGAAFGPWLLGALGLRDHRVIGIAMGVGGHGIGTARAFQLSEKAGAFSSLAMALNGIMTAILIPVLASVMHLHPGARTIEASPPPTTAPPAALPLLVEQIHGAGLDLWALMLSHQSELLTSVSIMLTLASLVTLAIASKMMRGHHQIDRHRIEREKAADETIAALERLVARQALRLDAANTQSRLAATSADLVVDGKTLLFRRPTS